MSGNQSQAHRHPLRRDESHRLHHPLLRRRSRQPPRLDHRHRIRAHIRHIQPPIVRAQRQRHRLRTKITLPRQPRIEVPLHLKLRRRSASRHVHRRHRIPVRQRHIQRLPIRAYLQRAWMRPRLHRIARFQQRQPPRHLPILQIKLHNLARIPQRDKPSRPILRHRQRHRISTRHNIALRQIEPRHHFSRRHIHQQHIVRQIIRNQQPLANNQIGCPIHRGFIAMSGILFHHRNRRRIRHSRRPIHPANQLRPSRPRQLLQPNRYQSLRRNLPCIEPIHRNPVPNISLLTPRRIGQRSHARVQMPPIPTERQPRVQTLLARHRRTLIGKVRHNSRPRIHHRQRLFVLRLERSIPRIQRHHIPSIRRHRHRHRLRVHPLRTPRHHPHNLLARRQIHHHRTRPLRQHARCRARNNRHDPAQPNPRPTPHSASTHHSGNRISHPHTLTNHSYIPITKLLHPTRTAPC